jgi:hypothetical protein
MYILNMCLLKSELAREKISTLVPAIVLLISKLLENSVDLTLVNLESEFHCETESLKAQAKSLLEWICLYEEISEKELTSCRRKFECESLSSVSRMNLIAHNNFTSGGGRDDKGYDKLDRYN